MSHSLEDEGPPTPDQAENRTRPDRTATMVERDFMKRREELKKKREDREKEIKEREEKLLQKIESKNDEDKQKEGRIHLTDVFDQKFRWIKF
jgi:hypothetical protein